MKAVREIVVYAQNVNIGGAKILLQTLVEGLLEAYPDTRVRVLLGNSGDLEVDHPRLIAEILPGTWARIRAMWRREDNVFYFGNLPPMRRATNSLLYVHNLYMTLPPGELLRDSSVGIGYKLKYAVLGMYLRCFAGRVETVACQTRQMQERIERILPVSTLVAPFSRPVRKLDLPEEFDLCYVGIPSEHKNHGRFLEALSILSAEGVPARVAVTIPDSPGNADLLAEVGRLNREARLEISNAGFVSFEEACSIYNRSRALCFPSLKESYGLPVVEAVSLGLALLIADLPYADVLVRGGERFDPESARSMADAIKRFLEAPSEIPPAALRDADSLEKIMEKVLGQAG